MSFKDQFKFAKEKMAAAKKEATEIAKQAFNEGTATVFAAHPKLKSFSWRQYTPYFNDGDACTFRACTDYFDVEFDGEKHEELSDWQFTYEKSDIKNDLELKAAHKSLKEFMSCFDEGDLLELFGDHASVKVAASGTEVMRYEHD